MQFHRTVSIGPVVYKALVTALEDYVVIVSPEPLEFVRKYNAEREVDDIDVREGVDVYKEADNIDMELDDEQESVDWEAAANVEDADIVVEGGDREEADNVVEGGDGEEADNVDEGRNGEVDVSDFPETDDVVLELYPEAYFVDPEAEAETRKIAMD
ncbi:hypothetical protein CJ030_MR5G019113 [Morella rubra]|nr:hypothetical protein CJ030_MR5G019113 [Morella rubra]